MGGDDLDAWPKATLTYHLHLGADLQLQGRATGRHLSAEAVVDDPGVACQRPGKAGQVGNRPFACQAFPCVREA
jgi:hypothetical protein